MGVLALAALSFGVQLLVTMGFAAYCSENIEPGTRRETVCGAADPEGYFAAVLVPPLAVVIAGVVAYGSRRTGILLAVFAAALLSGILVPVAIGLFAGYR